MRASNQRKDKTYFELSSQAVVVPTTTWTFARRAAVAVQSPSLDGWTDRCILLRSVRDFAEGLVVSIDVFGQIVEHMCEYSAYI